VASTPKFTDVHRLVEFRGGEFLHQLQRIVDGISLARRQLCPSSSWFVYYGSHVTPLHIDAHAAGAAGDGAHRRVQVGSRSNPAFSPWRCPRAACGTSCPTFAVFGVALPFGMPSALAMSTDAGGVFMMKVKAAVAVYRNHNWGRQSFFQGLRLRIERLAELHDVHALLAQCGADRRTEGLAWPAGICSLM
jgi:hypothetical protein